MLSLVVFSWAGVAPDWLRPVTVLLTPPLGAGANGRAALLAAVPQGWVHRDAHGDVIASDGRAVAEDVMLHTPSLMTSDARTGRRWRLWRHGCRLLASRVTGVECRVVQVLW